MKIPTGRTGEYAVWRACERFGILPPNAKETWDECNLDVRCMLIAFDQIRQNEEIDIASLGIKLWG